MRLVLGAVVVMGFGFGGGVGWFGAGHDNRVGLRLKSFSGLNICIFNLNLYFSIQCPWNKEIYPI